MADRREFFEKLIYYSTDGRRFTQHSPVMPDVWIRYGLHPGQQQELLMVPDWNYTTADLARALKEQLSAVDRDRRMSRFRDTRKGRKPAAVASNQNVVVATLWFDQMVRAVLPLSRWWLRSVAGVLAPGDEDLLIQRLADPERLIAQLTTAANARDAELEISAETAWLARNAGLLAYLSSREGRGDLRQAGRSDDRQVARLEKILQRHRQLATALVDLLQGIPPVEWERPCPLFSVNRNRQTSTAVYASSAAVKADAACRLFQVRGEGIRWAVVDTGIDATHVAFRRRDAQGQPASVPFVERTQKRRPAESLLARFRNETRVVATYDFVHVRELLGAAPSEVDRLDRERFPALKNAATRRLLKELLADVDSHVINWERWMPLLEVPHELDTYRPPANRHGTHVAGILAADWRVADEQAGLPGPGAHSGRDLVGISPAVELYDLRVLDQAGQGNEFAIMSALQFIRDLNARKDFVAIHGVNLSFSIEHDVANYACGRTPVCDEAERLVGSGVVVVAAAGNSGRARYLTPAGLADEGFRTVSITDPGNAESVITVGATHRSDAHTYGVSYFSSRGPTGDGRLKPDLVAPGEKIVSTIPGDADDQLDGTSMAAPHVSGAVALILSRHAELIGRPQRIKAILCATATDLQRERYFQGAGLLDILRALQSI